MVKNSCPNPASAAKSNTVVMIAGLKTTWSQPSHFPEQICIRFAGLAQSRRHAVHHHCSDRRLNPRRVWHLHRFTNGLFGNCYHNISKLVLHAAINQTATTSVLSRNLATVCQLRRFFACNISMSESLDLILLTVIFCTYYQSSRYSCMLSMVSICGEPILKRRDGDP